MNLNRITKTEALYSKFDDSVNFIHSGPEIPGYFESRFVARPRSDHFTCYLSVQSGCRQACRMCHLTTTKQTKTVDATRNELISAQAQAVFRHWYKVRDRAEHKNRTAVHFSFMARGEPLASTEFCDHGDTTMLVLGSIAANLGLQPRFLVSTIMPVTVYGTTLARHFKQTQPMFYYSIYSVDSEFRDKWLPKAMHVGGALQILKDYQDDTSRIVKLHWALIEGENDSLDDVAEIIAAVDKSKLRVDVNLVRYNPYSPVQGKEASETTYQLVGSLLRCKWPHSRIKIVPRVGFDIYASCGMFVGASGT